MEAARSHLEKADHRADFDAFLGLDLDRVVGQRYHDLIEAAGFWSFRGRYKWRKQRCSIGSLR